MATGYIVGLKGHRALQGSGRRAKAVMDFFLESGIASNRLEYKAMGETQPKVPNDTEENRAQNRRVEFQIN